MAEDVYVRLARRLDTLPNGFPPTASGVELRLLAKIFTPEEAALASVMRLSCEPASEIAARAGVEPRVASRILKEMVRKGQIRASKGEGQLLFGLLPFAVGFYEEQLPRMDKEMAMLVEQYFQETGGAGVSQPGPPLHRVIPVEEAIPFAVQIFPYERATELIEEARAWGVRDCICRVQQRLVGRGCAHELETCLVFAPVEGAFDGNETIRPLTKEEALRLLRRAEEAGLVHTVGNYRDGIRYICNCCTCCCGILRGVAEFGVPSAVAHSAFYAVVEETSCLGCGSCVERCQFGALSVQDEVCQVDYARCVGCGVCVIGCPSGALHLQRRPEEEVPPLPSDIRTWMLRRAEERGVPLSEVL